MIVMMAANNDVASNERRLVTRIAEEMIWLTDQMTVYY